MAFSRKTCVPHRCTLSAAFLTLSASILGLYSSVSAVVLPERDIAGIKARANSPTSVCKRWSGQSALVNGTLYYYGGRTLLDATQDSNEWNNDFITLDLTTSWQISNPPLTGLPQPDGPPAVSLGFLWSSLNSLYLYGGQYSDNPPARPQPLSLWSYNLGSKTWVRHSDPTLSSGDYAPQDGIPVQGAAEGAGVSVPSLGRGFYFGGHLDSFTTPGWSNQIPRVYLNSLLEFTFPGSSNPDVNALSTGQVAGSDGAWRNVTDAGTQAGAGFPQRADGALVYVPGFSDAGILIGLAGGTASTLNQMNIIDVFDVSTSAWYKQSTSGTIPDFRVNPCAVVAAAADGSSYNVYMYGGQSLVFNDTSAQIPKDDVWILSIPSFTWIQVNAGGQVPYGRSGHTCSVWDAQMVVVGGWVGEQLSCDAPGYYVFDLSTLEWKTEFTSRSSPSTNPQSQQLSQQGQSSGMQGSYGYTVPDVVQSVVGGGPSGGATVTAPVATATAGPLATGSPPHYSVNPVEDPSGSNSGSSGSGDDGPNVGAIVAGVIAGVLFLLACYLLFCIFLYRRRLAQYRQNLDAAHDLVQAESSESNRVSAEKGAFAWSGKNKQRERSKTPTFTRGRSPAAGVTSGDTGMREYTHQREKSVDDLLVGMEPTFVGIMLHPRRSLRVVNR